MAIWAATRCSLWHASRLGDALSASNLADAVEFMLEPQPVERDEGQGDKDLDAVLDLAEGGAKGIEPGQLVALDGNGIRRSPKFL